MNERLVLRIAHDRDAFESFYREHIERVQRFVARRVDDPYLAADLTAEIFLAALDSAAGYRSELGTPTGWLYGVAYHVISAERRRSARELQTNARIVGRRLLNEDDLARSDERIDAAAEARRLYRAMDQLPPSERIVLELVALDSLTVAAAARVIGIRPVTARVRLHRAREKLRHALTPPPAPATPEAIR